MANKPQDTEATASPETQSPTPITQLQEAGFRNMMGMGTAWVEAMSDMSAEMLGFVADRIKEDVKVQHQILHCKGSADLQRIQGEFLQKAMDQYRVETGKLVEMGTKALGEKSAD